LNNIDVLPTVDSPTSINWIFSSYFIIYYL